MNFIRFFDDLADEFLAALVHDFRDPVIQKHLLRQIHGMVNSIQNPMLRMLALDYVEKGLDYVKEKATPFFKEVVLSDPPDSVDASATVVKDVVNNKVDSFAERIKKELENQKRKKENINQ